MVWQIGTDYFGCREADGRFSMARLQEAVGSVSFSPFGAPPAGYALDFPLVDATTAKGLTQEIRVAGDGERTDWVLGSFYSTSERQYGQSAYAEHYVAVNGAAVTDFLRLVTGVPDLVWSGSRALAGHPDTEELFYSDLNYHFDQLALFGEVSLAVTDRFSLTGGLRWYDFDEERTQQTFDGLFADPLDSEGTTSATGLTLVPAAAVGKFLQSAIRCFLVQLHSHEFRRSAPGGTIFGGLLRRLVDLCGIE